MLLETRLRTVFNTVLELDAMLPDTGLHYRDTPGWDSLGAVLLISAIESEFQVELGIQRALGITTFSDAAALLRELGVADQPGTAQ